MGSKIINFKDLKVEHPNRYKVTDSNGSEDIKKIDFDPGLIYQQGTPESAENFNNIQKNCIYEVSGVRILEGQEEIYDISIDGFDNFEFESLKILMTPNATNTIKGSFVRLNGAKYIIKNRTDSIGIGQIFSGEKVFLSLDFSLKVANVTGVLNGGSVRTLKEIDDSKVNKNGDTMTGQLAFLGNNRPLKMSNGMGFGSEDEYIGIVNKESNIWLQRWYNNGSYASYSEITAPRFRGKLIGNSDTTTKLATQADITIGNKAHPFDGSSGLVYTLDEIGAFPSKDVYVSDGKTSPYGLVPRIDSNGIFEIGRYIDFHMDKVAKDYNFRISCLAENVLDFSGSLQINGTANFGSKTNYWAEINRASNYVMFNRRNDSTDIADSFIGINGTTEKNLIYRYNNPAVSGKTGYLEGSVYHTGFKPEALRTSRNITVGSKTNAFDGSSNISFNHSEANLAEKLRWTAVVKWKTWSRVAKLTQSSLGANAVFTVNYTRGSVVVNDVITVVCGHSGNREFTVFGGGYSKCKYRLGFDDGNTNDSYLEIYDDFSDPGTSDDLLSFVASCTTGHGNVTTFSSYTAGINGASEIRVIKGMNYACNIGVNGAISVTGNISGFSDIKLKKNIKIIPNALEKVCKVNGYTFDRKDIGVKQAGVIAQEIKEILPEVVTESEDGEEKTLSVAYGNMAGLFIEAIKELKKENDTLKEILKEKGVI